MAVSRKSHTGLARCSNAHNQAGNSSSSNLPTRAQYADREENGMAPTAIRLNGLAATSNSDNQAGTPYFFTLAYAQAARGPGVKRKMAV
jgi:hypothetical protein